MAKRKRKLNKRLVVMISIIGALFLLGGVAYFVRKMPRDPNNFLRLAEKERAAGAFDQAERNYSLAVDHAKRGNHPDIYYFYYKRGEFYLELCQFPTLSDVERTDKLNRAREDFVNSLLHRPNLDAQQKRFDMIWRGNIAAFLRKDPANPPQWATVVNEATKLIGLDSNNPKSYAQRAFAVGQQAILLNKADLADQAEQDYRKAIELNRGEVGYWRDLALLLTDMKRTASAQEVFEQGLGVNPDSDELRVAYASFLRQQDKRDEARKQVDTVIAQHPDRVSGYLAKASFSYRDKRYDEALQSLELAKKADPGDIRIYLFEAEIVQQKQQKQKRLDQVASVYRAGLAAIANRGTSRPTTESIMDRRQVEQAREELNVRLANILLDMAASSKGEDRTKAIAEAKSCAETLTGTDNPYRMRIMGRVSVLEGRPADAIRLLEEANRRFGGADIFTASALVELYLQQGWPGKAQDMLSEILKRPGVNKAAMWLIKAKLSMEHYRNYDEAVKDVGRALAEEPDNAEALSLKQALNVARSPKPVVPDDLEITPGVVFILTQVADERLLAGDVDAALGLLESLSRRDKDNLSVAMRLQNLYMLLGQNDRAKLLLENLQKSQPDNRRIAAELKVLDEKDVAKQFDRRIDLINNDSSLNAFRKEVEKGYLALNINRLSDALGYFQRAFELDPKSVQVADQLLTMGIANKDEVLIAKVLEKAKEGNLDRAEGHSWAARAALAKGDWAKAKAETDEALRVTPDHKIAQVMQAECLIKGGPGLEDVTRAEDILRSIASKDPGNVRALLLLAQLTERKGNMAEHAELINRLSRLAPRDAYVIRQSTKLIDDTKLPLDEIIAKRERTLQAELSDGGRIDLANAEKLADAYRRNRDNDKYRKMCELIYKAHPDAALGLAAKCEYLLLVNKTTEIDRLFQALIDTYPDKVLAYLQWSRFLIRYDTPMAATMAERAIRTAIELGGPRDERGYKALAFHFVRLRDWREAAEAMKMASDIKGSDPTLKRLMIQYNIYAGNYGLAAKAIDSMIASDGSDWEAYTLRGLLEMRLGDIAKAKEALDRAVSLNPTACLPLLYRSELFQAMSDWAAAKKDLLAAVSLSPTPEVMLRLAALNHQLNENDQAEALYKDVLALQKDNDLAYTRLIELYMDMQQWDRLDALLTEAINAFAGDPRFYMARAKMWLRRGDKAKRLEALANAYRVMLSPDLGVLETYFHALLDAGKYDVLLRDSGNYTTLPILGPVVISYQGAALARKNDLANAEVLFRKSIASIGRLHLPVVAMVVESGYGLGRAVEVVAAWAQADKTDWRMYYVKGLLLAKASEQDTAYRQAQAEALAKACELASDPRDKALVQTSMGLAYSALHDVDRAEASYRAVLAVEKNDPRALNNLAWLLVNERNDAASALPLAKRALDLLPEDPGVMETYGWVLAKSGALGEAERILVRATLTRDPPETIRYYLGYVYEKNGRLEDARKAYRQMLEALRNRQTEPMYKTVSDALARVENSLRSGK